MFFTENQGGRQNGGKAIFLQKSRQWTLQIPCVSNFFLEPFPRKIVFHVEIQDGHQKWRESDFLEKSPVYSTDTHPVGQTFVEITLSRTISEINVFPFTQKFKMATKNGG